MGSQELYLECAYSRCLHAGIYPARIARVDELNRDRVRMPRPKSLQGFLFAGIKRLT